LHRRAADQNALDSLQAPGASQSVQAALNRKRAELQAQLRIEDLVVSSQKRGSSTLDRRPMRHDWCAALSNTDQGVYYFCEWLKTSECEKYKPSNARDVAPRLGTIKGGTASVPTSVNPSLATSAKSTGVLSPTLDKQNANAIASPDDWRLPLGDAYELRPTSKAFEDDSLGAGSFEIEYKPKELAITPTISGAGISQTYLIFGGPGAGKTHYFKYLLSSLLKHPLRPGCLLLDPKGGELTPWLAGELAEQGRDLTVLCAGANKTEFNVLGHDLQAKELGRLLSEVVLAGAPGVDEGWAVLIGDLLESAAVIIAADETTQLTAANLLRDILYRSDFKYRSGKLVKEYPIVFRALRIGAKPKSLDVRIACDRIAEYFSNSLEPRQRRFVRQIIERTLGELMLPEWQYLSSPKGEDTVYSDIIERGRVVSVAVGQASPAFQRSLSTLVKSIFQQAVLANLSRRARDKQKAPFFILACDEYAQAITEGETGLVSDSRFFSLSREAGCLSLLALQSVATGRSRFPAAMKDRWDGILGNVTVKFFMRLNDVETAELGSTLAGSYHAFVEVVSQQRSVQGLSATNAVTMVQSRRVPPWYLTNHMKQGHALVHGTLDGRSAPTTVFIHAP
ncbi:MAG TPA: TraM recognition domain-containing protein, partial [Opitutaceae bacterium]